MALGSAQPVAEVSARESPGGCVGMTTVLATPTTILQNAQSEEDRMSVETRSWLM